MWTSQNLKGGSTKRWRNLKTQKSPAILNLCLRTDSNKEITWLRPHKNERPTSSNSSGLKKVFEKLRFGDRLALEGRLNHRNKATLSNFCGVLFCGWAESNWGYVFLPFFPSFFFSLFTFEHQISASDTHTIRKHNHNCFSIRLPGYFPPYMQTYSSNGY